MALSLATLFVDIVGKDSGFQKMLSGVKVKLESVKQSLSGVATKAAVAFAAGTAAIGFFAKAAIEGDDAVNNLRFALEANKHEVDGNLEKLGDLAEALKGITTFDDDAIRQGMAKALNMGIKPEELEDVSKAGIGLAKIFGGDLQQGFHAAAAAARGNFRELRSLVPEMAALSDSEIQTRIGELAGAGFAQAQRETATLGGQIKQLGNALGDAAKAIGGAFLPYIQQLVQWVKQAADWFIQLPAATKEMIAKFTLIGLAIAGVLVVLPIFIGMLSTLVAIIAAILSPIGLIVTAIVALGGALMYAVGTGDTFFERITSGFFKVVEVVAIVTGAIVRAFAWVYKTVFGILFAIVDATLWAFQKVAEGVDWIVDALGGTTHIGEFFQDLRDGADKATKVLDDANKSVDNFGKNLMNADADKMRKSVGEFIDGIKDKFSVTPKLNTEGFKADLNTLDFKVPPPINSKEDKAGADKKVSPISSEEFFKQDLIARLASGQTATNANTPEKKMELHLNKVSNNTEAIKMYAKAMQAILENKLNYSYK